MTELTKEQQDVIDAAIKWTKTEIVNEQVAAYHHLKTCVKAYQQSIEPKTDWSKVPFGACVKANGYEGRYCGYHHLDESLILHIYSEQDGEIFKEPEKNCTLIEPEQTYTTPIWHKWTGERPNWMQDDDFVIYRPTGEYEYFDRAALLCWDSITAIEFMVIKGGQD